MLRSLTNTDWQVNFFCGPGPVFVTDDHWLSKPRHDDITIVTLYDCPVTGNETSRLLDNNAITDFWQCAASYHCKTTKTLNTLHTPLKTTC